jgi:hypothetical protein
MKAFLVYWVWPNPGGWHYNDPKVMAVLVACAALVFLSLVLRYGFSWTDGTGYITRNLYYDNNLLYYPPPYFPTGTQYELDLWEEL